MVVKEYLGPATCSTVRRHVFSFPRRFVVAFLCLSLSVNTYSGLAHAAPAGQQSGSLIPDPLRQAKPLSQPLTGAADRPEGLLHLDVAVTEPTGRYVAALHARDFTGLDNGQPRKVVSFQAYGGATEARPDPPVSITLVLDMLGESFEDTVDERTAVLAYLRQNGGHLAQPTSILMLTQKGLWISNLSSVSASQAPRTLGRFQGEIDNFVNASALQGQPRSRAVVEVPLRDS